MNNFLNNYGQPYPNSTGFQPYNFNNYPAVPNIAPQNYTNLIYVSGIDDAKSRMVPNGSTMIFADNDKPLLYKKSVDNKGQFTLEVYDIIPHKDEPKPVAPKDFVSKTEFEAIQKEVNSLKETIMKLTTKKEEVSNGSTTISSQE